MLEDRIKHLQQRLSEWNIGALLLEQPIDLYYLLGIDVSRGRLVIYPDDVQLFVDGRYFDMAREQCTVSVFPWEKKQICLEARGINAQVVGFDSSSTTVDEFKALQNESAHINWTPLPRPLKEARSIKDASEIKLMREAAAITWQGILHAKQQLKVGISEQEVAFEFEHFVRKNGASSLAFPSIVAFGKHSAYPHHRTSDTTLQRGDIVLLDVGAVYDHYCADVTRMVFFGSVHPKLRELFDLVLEASLAARTKVVLGQKIGAIDKAARDVFEREGKLSLFTHSLGHGVGLKVHEYPLIKWDGPDSQNEIKEGMVFTIEPGLYQPGLGGVRLEDTGLVAQSGFEPFYPPIEEVLKKDV